MSLLLLLGNNVGTTPSGLAAIATAPRAYAPPSSRVTYAAWLCNPQGYRVQLIPDFVSLQYGLAIRGGGNFKMELAPNVATTYLKDLGFVEIWRKVGGRVPTLEDVFVIQSKPVAAGRRGTRFVDIEGPSVTDFLLGANSRVVSHLTGATGGNYASLPADNIAKSVVLDVMGAGAGNSGLTEGRDLSVYLGLRSEISRSLGPTITVDAYLKGVNDILSTTAKLSEQAASSPKRMFYTMRPYSFNPLRFEFVTFLTYYGRYRGFSSANPVILSPLFGSLAEMERENDRREEVNSVFVTYNTKASTTRITDTMRRNIAPHGFRETYRDAANSGTQAAAEIEASDTLNAGKPRRLTRARVTNSATTRYGAEYHLGDVVGLLGLGLRLEAEVSGVSVQLNAGSLPDEQIKLEDL